jgi:hypothetical protein
VIGLIGLKTLFDDQTEMSCFLSLGRTLRFTDPAASTRLFKDSIMPQNDETDRFAL